MTVRSPFVLHVRVPLLITRIAVANRRGARGPPRRPECRSGRVVRRKRTEIPGSVVHLGAAS
jgi:hypothetical protein